MTDQGPREIGFESASGERVDILVGLVRDYYALDGIAFAADDVRRALIELLANESIGGAWLVFRGEVLAGYFVLTYGFDLEFGGRQATVTELYLRPAARRGGVGTAAIACIEEHLRSVGIAAYELQVERGNAGARAFYGRLGFEARDRIPMSKRIA